MAFNHGKVAKVFLGALDASQYFNEVVTTKMADANETTTFGLGAKTFIAGLGDGKISVKGLYDGTPAGVDTLVNQLLGTNDTVTTVCPAGTALGSPAYLGYSNPVGYSATAPVADVVSTSLDLQADGGFHRAVVLAGAFSVSNTVNQSSAAVDNGASTANGGLFSVHVTSNTMNAVGPLLLQHSADNATWVTLASYSIAAGTTSAALVSVPTGTTVNRYLRVNYNNNALGTTVLTSSFHRRA